MVAEKWIRHVPEERQPNYYDTPYFKLCALFPKDVFLDSLTYKAQPDDVFIVTYPKSGTTWTQYIVYLLQHDAIMPTWEEFSANSVFLELRGRKAAESIIQPGAIKAHLPYEITPWNDESKYIVVIRNPKDVLVSFYHHVKGMDLYYNWTDGSFDDFFDMFIGGQVDYGDYYLHVNSWLEKRHLPNVLILTYEHMKTNIKDAIRKIAHFMDPIKYGSKVDSDEPFLDEIIQKSAIKKMREQFEAFSNACSLSKEFDFFRKGVVNDWKSYFSHEQNELINERFREEAENCPYLLELWDDYAWLNDPVNDEKKVTKEAS